MTQIVTEALLEPRFVGDITGRFFVPAYQRGYRWGSHEVGKLLDDIWEHVDAPYYLQPVVVKQRDDEWELVDGQQRLTTLFLILQFMEKENLQSAGASYDIRYETRENSASYLRSLDPERREENIDFYHLFAAQQKITEWFQAHGARRQHVANKIYGALFDQVRVIWYQADDSVDATTLFQRLNVGRIPLTDAELIKAQLLTRSKGLTGLTDRDLKIAGQWDQIERDLNAPEMWSFVTATAADAPTRISLLLDLIAGGPTGRERPLFHTFETLRDRIEADPQSFWDEVLALHALILGWHESRTMFHKVGFLTADGVPLPALVAATHGKRKKAFEADLDNMIRRRLMLTENELRDLTYQDSKTNRTLLLANVQSILEHPHSNERYSFAEHAFGSWSLEHIHAQNAEPLTKADQWDSWLRLHREVLVRLSGAGFKVDDLLDRIDEVLSSVPIAQDDFRSLEHDVVQALSTHEELGDDDEHAIANLALLDRVDNSVLNNSVFAVKRSHILERDRGGSYIPVCTRNVFLKYYSPADEHQMLFWSSTDRACYVDEIVRVLHPYLTPEEGTDA